MHQTTHFFNLGYGWLCKHCSSEDTERKHHSHHHHNHSEHHHRPSVPALAKWIDEEHHGLTCPRCGIEERLTRTFH